MGYRTAASHISKDPVKRARQLANLKPGGKKIYPDVPKGPGLDTAYKTDIVRFCEEQFRIPETRKPVKLFDWQKEEILHPMFQSKPLPTLAILGMTKKSGKSTIAAMIAAWKLFCGEPYGEIYLAARDKEQASWIIFDKVLKAIGMNAEMAKRAKCTRESIENKKTGTVVRPLSCDVSAAGLNPSLTIFDELWSYEHEHMKAFYDEMTTVPTRKNPLTLIVSYAGYDEDSLLYELYQKGLAGDDPRMFFYWSHKNRCPWQTPEYLETQQKRLRPATYRRLHMNEWTAGQESFCTADEILACTDGAFRGGKAPQGIYLGIDIGLKHDCSAVAGVTPEDEGVRLVDHELYVPRKQVLKIEETVERTILELHKRYQIRKAFYDPYQFERSAQSLRAKGIRCVEYPQTVSNTVRMSETLSTLLQNQRLKLYPSAEVKAHLLNARAKETERGWRIVKSKKSKKIDLAVAMAMACQAAVGGIAQGGPRIRWIPAPEEEDE